MDSPEAGGTGADAPGNAGTAEEAEEKPVPGRIRPGWDTADVVRAYEEAEGKASPYRAAPSRPQYAEAPGMDSGPDYLAVREEYERDPPSRERAEKLEREADTLLHRARAAEEQAEEYNDMRPTLVKPGEMDWTPEEIGAWQQRGFDLRQQAGELNQQARERLLEAEQERQRQDAWEYVQLMGEYASIRQRADWAEKSQTDPTRMTPIRETRYAPKYDAAGNLMGTGILDSGYEDLWYAIINGDEGAFNIQATEDSNSLGSMDHSCLLQRNEYEREFYNYLYDIQGKKAAEEYLNRLTPWLNARQRQENTETWQKYADENPSLTSAYSVLISPLKAASFLDRWRTT